MPDESFGRIAGRDSQDAITLLLSTKPAIHFPHFLYVVYTKKTDDTENRDLYRPLDQSNYAVSIITLQGPYAQFDKNGIVVQGGPIFEGAWASQRLSDMLPVDYVPDDAK